MSLLSDFLGNWRFFFDGFSDVSRVSWKILRIIELIQQTKHWLFFELVKETQKHRHEIRFTSRLDEQNNFYNLNSINGHYVWNMLSKNKKTVLFHIF